MFKILKISVLIILLTTFAVSIFAQKKSRQLPAKKSATAKPKPTATVQTPEIVTTVKKNERPDAENPAGETSNEPQKVNQITRKNERPAEQKTNFEPDYVYEFSQPDFVFSNIKIEHDESGKGKISFLKQGFDTPITDPLQLSAVTLEKIKTAFQAVNYFAAGENYQYEKDYSHLGNTTVNVKKDGQTRTTKFNYTTNKDAKTLADEYRKIGQQAIWIFEMNVARENQPLDTPKMMDTLDSYLTRGEISDPAQMSPYLKELSNDERLPLIARNHATRLMQKIEKTK